MGLSPEQMRRMWPQASSIREGFLRETGVFQPLAQGFAVDLDGDKQIDFFVSEEVVGTQILLCTTSMRPNLYYATGFFAPAPQTFTRS